MKKKYNKRATDAVIRNLHKIPADPWGRVDDRDPCIGERLSALPFDTFQAEAKAWLRDKSELRGKTIEGADWWTVYAHFRDDIEPASEDSKERRVSYTIRHNGKTNHVEGTSARCNMLSRYADSLTTGETFSRASDALDALRSAGERTACRKCDTFLSAEANAEAETVEADTSGKIFICPGCDNAVIAEVPVHEERIHGGASIVRAIPASTSTYERKTYTFA